MIHKPQHAGLTRNPETARLLESPEIQPHPTFDQSAFQPPLACRTTTKTRRWMASVGQHAASLQPVSAQHIFGLQSCCSGLGTEHVDTRLGVKREISLWLADFCFSIGGRDLVPVERRLLPNSYAALGFVLAWHSARRGQQRCYALSIRIFLWLPGTLKLI